MIQDTTQQKTRSIAQNRAIHKYCTELADLLNEHGVSKSVFYEDIQADYTMENIKELWRSFAKAKYNKNSTTELSTNEVNKIYEEINRHISQFGIELPFPCQDFMSLIESYET